jgi:hypothetical protein
MPATFTLKGKVTGRLGNRGSQGQHGLGASMESSEFTRMLLYSVCVNYAVLIIWFLAFMVAHDKLYRVHAKWFRLSLDAFDAIHYAGMAVYKIGILLINVAPLVAVYLSRSV